MNTQIRSVSLYAILVLLLSSSNLTLLHVVGSSKEGSGEHHLCLNMIVKNEEPVLERLLQSVKDHVDYYVIVDTGSTDSTISLIQKEMVDYGVSGELHEQPWVNYGHNRHQALELAVKAGCHWVLFIDADDSLATAPDTDFTKSLEPGTVYLLEKRHSGYAHSIPALVDVKAAKWAWRGPVHEYLECVEGACGKRELRTDVWIAATTGEGIRSRAASSDEDKFMRDARLLEAYLKENPDSPREQFYLGRSYFDAEKMELALEAYRKRVTMGGYDEERFYSQLEIGRIMTWINSDKEEMVMKEYLEAFAIRPHRGEPLHGLASYFHSKEEFAKAYVFAKAGVDLPVPATSSNLFLTVDVYKWKLLDEMCAVAFYAGKYVDGQRACIELIKRITADGDVHPAERHLQRYRENLQFYNDKLGSPVDADDSSSTCRAA